MEEGSFHEYSSSLQPSIRAPSQVFPPLVHWRYDVELLECVCRGWYSACTICCVAWYPWAFEAPSPVPTLALVGLTAVPPCCDTPTDSTRISSIAESLVVPPFVVADVVAQLLRDVGAPPSIPWGRCCSRSVRRTNHTAPLLGLPSSFFFVRL